MDIKIVIMGVKGYFNEQLERRVMKVKRNDKIYDVVDYKKESGDICVEDTFDFALPPYKRKLKMWWLVKDCEIVDGYLPGFLVWF